jgi:hypothetical protein
VIGLSTEETDSLIRVSFRRFISNDETEFALQPIGSALAESASIKAA